MGCSVPENLKVLYLASMPYSPGYEGISKEISLLRQVYPGRVLTPPGRFGKYGWGDATSVKYLGWRWNPFFKWYQHSIRSLQRDHSIVHIFSERLFSKLLFYSWEKPVIYSCVSRVTGKHRAFETQHLRRISQLILSDRQDKVEIDKLGIVKTRLILPAVKPVEPGKESAKGKEFTILMASAPLNKGEFQTKGIFAILKAVEQIPDVHFVFLWRGVLEGYLKKLIRSRGLGDRITVVNKVVDTAVYFNNVDATLYIGTEPGELKSYPQSIMESLWAGKPVIVVAGISISEIVSRENNGVVIKPDTTGLIKGIIELRSRYREMQESCIETAARYFSVSRFVEEYGKVYHEVSAR